MCSHKAVCSLGLESLLACVKVARFCEGSLTDLQDSAHGSSCEWNATVLLQADRCTRCGQCEPELTECSTAWVQPLGLRAGLYGPDALLELLLQDAEFICPWVTELPEQDGGCAS